MNRGIDIGSAAMYLISSEWVKEAGENGPNIDQCVERISHLDGTKADLREAIAYLACQVNAYRRIANEDAALAIYNIESVVRNYRERRG